MRTENALTTQDLATEINREHSEALQAANDAIGHALRCGELLSKAKAEMSHGEWLPWLDANCQFSRRTAQAYMKLHRERDALPKNATAAHLTINGALRSLAKKDEPEPKPESPLQEAERNVARSILDNIKAYDEARQAAEEMLSILIEEGAKKITADHCEMRIDGLSADDLLVKGYGWDRGIIDDTNRQRLFALQRRGAFAMIPRDEILEACAPE